MASPLQYTTTNTPSTTNGRAALCPAHTQTIRHLTLLALVHARAMPKGA